MEERDLLYAEAKLGVQCKEFLKTPVGKLIIGRADKAHEEAFEAWVGCDADDSATIRELQFRARLPLLISQWLEQAINQATLAEETLQEIE